MELRRNIIKNSIYSILEFGWPVVTALLATPYIVHKLGTDAYGILALVSVTLGFFGVLDLGLTGAAIKYIAEYYEKKDFDMINKILSSTILAYGLIGTVVALFILGTTDLLVVKILKVPPQFIEVAKFAFYLAAFGFLLNLVLGIFAAIPKAVQRYDISTKIGIIIGTLNILGMVGLLYYGYWLRELVILGIVISILSFVVYFWVAKKLIPSLRIKWFFDKKMFMKLLSFGSFFLLTSMSAVILFHLDKLIIGSILGVSVVAFYVIPGNIASKIQGLINAAGNVAFPASSALSGGGQIDKLHKLYFEGTRVLLIIATMLSVPLVVFAEKFLLHWIGADFATQSTNVMRILVVTYYMLSIGMIPWAISLGSGRSKINAFFAFFTAFLNISFLLLVVRTWGIVGAALAYLISTLISIPLMIGYIERKILKLPGFKFWIIFSKIFIVSIAQAFFSLLLLPFAVNIFATLALMGASALSFVAIYIILGFWEEGDKKILNIFLEKFGISKSSLGGG